MFGWEVQHEVLGEGWVNTWTESVPGKNTSVPQRFATGEEAARELLIWAAERSEEALEDPDLAIDLSQYRGYNLVTHNEFDISKLKGVVLEKPAHRRAAKWAAEKHKVIFKSPTGREMIVALCHDSEIAETIVDALNHLSRKEGL